MSTVKKRGLQDMQCIGPSYSLAFGIGAMSVFVVVPHPEQVPRSRVAVASCPVWATLSLITVASKLSVVQAPGDCGDPAGAISLSDTHILQYCVVYVYKLW